MKVEIVNIETIKPSSPTPVHLKTYKFSVLDQVAPSVYLSLVLLYPVDVDYNAGPDRYDQFSQTLKNSLSDTLTLFPPVAGKIKDNVSVDCNDDGVKCYETRVHSTLDQLVLDHRNNIEYLQRLIVVGDDVNVNVNADTGVQLLVQINLFECGGIALGVSFSHKLCDAATIATFLNSWSAKATNSGQVILPDLTVSTIFPPRRDLSAIRPYIASPAHDMTAARLVFDGPKIAALKAELASQSTPQPTRVEAVTALIVKCRMAASKTINKKNCLMPSVIVHPVNIRKKLIPSLSENAVGNVLGAYQVYSEESDTSLETLVDELRKRRMEYCDSLALSGEKAINDYVETAERATLMVPDDSVRVYIFSSWCRFGLYDADFGMGKPIWIGVPLFLVNMHLTYLMDTRNGNGIEAYVLLPKQEMALFQTDPLLLHYASINTAA